MPNVKHPNGFIILPGGQSSRYSHPRPDQATPITPDEEPVSTLPNYAGRLLALNPDSGQKRFQCGGFYLGPPKLLAAVVPPEAQMAPIHAALLGGILVDITDKESIQTKDSQLEAVKEQDTAKKLYLINHPEHGFLTFGTDDPEIQKDLDRQINEGVSVIDLPPGYDASGQPQDKYLLKVEKKEPLLDRVKAKLHELVDKL